MQVKARLIRNALRASRDVVAVNDANGDDDDFAFKDSNGGIALEDAANVAVAGDIVNIAGTAGDGASNEETLEQFGYDFQDKNDYDNDSEEGDSY